MYVFAVSYGLKIIPLNHILIKFVLDTEEWLRNCTNNANCPNSTLFSCAIDECSSLGTCDDCAPTAIDCYQKLETYKADREADTCFTDIHNFTSAILFRYI